MHYKVGDLLRHTHPIGTKHLGIVTKVEKNYTEIYWLNNDTRKDNNLSWIRDHQSYRYEVISI